MKKGKVIYAFSLFFLILLSGSFLVYLVCFFVFNTHNALTLCPMATMAEVQEQKAYRVYFLAPLDKVPFPAGYECRTVFNDWGYEIYFVQNEEEEFAPLKGKMSF